MTTATRSNQPATVVVGIGASAGGVEAISVFLDNDTGQGKAAYLIAMHLSVKRESHLPEILARHTAMRVCRAEHGMPIEQGVVYVAPPGQVMTASDGRLHIAPINPLENTPTVIDRLFNSLADAYAERAIGVVLSGTGSDGALGLKAVRARGGLTIAQGEDGSAPQYPGMPESAVAAGAIDVQLPVEEIAGRLAATIALLSQPAGEARITQPPYPEQVRKDICTLLHIQVGHDFSGYKPSTFFRRVQRRMHVLQLGEVDAYVARLKASPAEVTSLFRDLLISVTSFFRDTESFAVLERDVIPALFRDKGADDEVRVWVPGCATGEEAYSLAILLLEHVGRLGAAAPALRVFATDIDERALQLARKGRYPSVLLDEVSTRRREQFFSEDSGYFTVRKTLREICTFSPHNVLRDPPFSRIDLVSCRNLMIYLGPEFQDRILPILHYALGPEGFLFVGVAEGAARHGNLFAPVSKEHRIFRRLPGAAGGVSLPPLARDETGASRIFATPAGRRSTSALRRQIETAILQTHAPAYVLVNAQGEALFYSGRTGNYLEFPPGAPSRHLMVNARKELRLGLRRALADVAATGSAVDLPEVSLPGDECMRRVQVRVEAFEGEAALYLVLFNDRGVAMPLSENVVDAGSHTVVQLERELRETRDQLQSTYEEFETAIEELRIANEELMSVNEELQSSNEELETSKEELQSVNEELQTVNNEMARHMEALDQANADLRGLLESTRIPTIFLDRHLAIRSFTQAATEVFTLIPSDRGRLITDLATRLRDLDLRARLELTQATGESFEQAVSRKDGSRHYLMCLLPYTGTAEETGGVVMTFVDVTALVDADARHKMMIGELNHRVRNMLAVVSAMANQTMAPDTSPERLDAFLGRLHAMARTYRLLTETHWTHMALRDLLQEELGAIAGVARFSLDGADVLLSPREALALGMVIHELATNALKYGALSNDHGRIVVAWQVADDGAVDLRWQEAAGPHVSQPEHRGFGSLLVERQLAYELGGRSSVTFATEGLVVAMHVPRAVRKDEVGS
ncbi:MAG TPA: chemotaxis protein CheB [Luteibacter sp.]|nr:chemotaxis protein CheB [Luteibacter sp.]